jgi:hypothetical protein
MKRTLAILILLASLVISPSAFGAAGTVATSFTKDAPAGIVRVTFSCIGGTAGDAGTVPDTGVPSEIIQLLTKSDQYYLYRVMAWPTGIGTSSFVFVDADVSTANDTITESTHGYSTGDPIDLSTTGTLPGGLSASTIYYVVAVDVDTISIATSAANAAIGTVVDITSAAGGGNHTLDATRPDAASAFIVNENGFDLLGSEDGSTTAYAGLNLIHATLARSTFPNMYLARAGLHSNYFPEITGALTLKQIDQATALAAWTVELTFVKGD